MNKNKIPLTTFVAWTVGLLAVGVTVGVALSFGIETLLGVK